MYFSFQDLIGLIVHRLMQICTDFLVGLVLWCEPVDRHIACRGLPALPFPIFLIPHCSPAESAESSHE